MNNITPSQFDPALYLNQTQNITTNIPNMASAKKAATEFEEQFVFSFLEEMSKNMPVNEQFGGGHAEEVFRSFFNQEIAKEMSHSEGPSKIGIADHVLKEILKLQEGSAL